MAIQIYNSLSRKKEEFAPLNPPDLNIYTCGVTVYDDCHIGHARSLYTFDVIRRYLRYRGFKVNFVRNITDIDDKIINRANELKTNWQELVKKYIESYYQDLKTLGIEKADFEPRATENIADMIRYIKGLIDKGYAYVTESGVYFNVRKFSGYGKLSGQSVDEMLTGVRKGSDEAKEDPLDFALWKSSKEGEPFWESPWGNGRPGWHIECSVMSQKYLKTDTLDIHAGGRDLIFPHHENELTQAQALTGKPFAKYWIHHGLLTINSQKMSKSLGNFVTIKDFTAKYNNADLLKLFFLSAHYSHPVDYTDEKIGEAKQALERIMILLDKMEKMSFPPKLKNPPFPELEEIKSKFIKAMDDDFNTPQALASVFELVNLANKNIDDLDFSSGAYKLFFELAGIFGLEFKKAAAGQSLDSEIEALIDKRDGARKRKDFAESDRLRKELEARGIILEDTKDGTAWRRKL
ncbi:MAG: cysteine--tRNA ligase [Candidatus Omnitrophica bacterium]|nr:cysteine--tRNA ligase [Candidatus Omnitrophota bacterium]